MLLFISMPIMVKELVQFYWMMSVAQELRADWSVALMIATLQTVAILYKVCVVQSQVTKCKFYAFTSYEHLSVVRAITWTMQIVLALVNIFAICY